jgi:hypothetical protein
MEQKRMKKKKKRRRPRMMDDKGRESCADMRKKIIVNRDE